MPKTLTSETNTKGPMGFKTETATKSKAEQRNLPLIFLSNIQSFGSSEDTDKSTEVEAILDLNQIDIAVLTETWLKEENKDQILLNNYIDFHAVRKDTLRSSGGVSIFVKDNIPANEINIKVPEHIEALWVSIRPKWLPRSISNIVVCGVYYPGSNSEYAPN